MKQFQLEIGDWSGDGHCQSRTVIFNTDLELQELREIYFKNCDKFGKVLENICSEYGESYLREEDLEPFLSSGMKISEDILDDIKYNGEYWVGTDQFVQWFIDFMKLEDDFHLEQVPENKLPMFHFYGYDEKKRHIGGFGYGIFGD